jgi:hypothetical protein
MKLIVDAMQRFHLDFDDAYQYVRLSDTGSLSSASIQTSIGQIGVEKHQIVFKDKIVR